MDRKQKITDLIYAYKWENKPLEEVVDQLVIFSVNDEISPLQSEGVIGEIRNYVYDGDRWLYINCILPSSNDVVSLGLDSERKTRRSPKGIK